MLIPKVSSAVTAKRTPVVKVSKCQILFTDSVFRHAQVCLAPTPVSLSVRMSVCPSVRKSYFRISILSDLRPHKGALGGRHGGGQGGRHGGRHGGRKKMVLFSADVLLHMVADKVAGMVAMTDFKTNPMTYFMKKPMASPLPTPCPGGCHNGPHDPPHNRHHEYF